MPFINKLAACWQRQHNLLPNPIIHPVPGWLMIPVHHDLEESKESWLLTSKFFLHCFFFYFFPCCPIFISLLPALSSEGLIKLQRHNPWDLFGWSRQGVPFQHPPKALQTRLPPPGLFPGGRNAHRSFSLDTGAVDDKEGWVGHSSLLCAPYYAAAVVETRPAQPHQLPPCMENLWVSHRKSGSRGAERRNRSVIDSSGSKGPRSGGIWSGH